ncbi:acyl-CoA/acyl-ACP dehydrogenase [Frondihabitans australicus]|uniref:Alkylation response protein AidB-like acyl-CoA dehydrogenase n=1 Tax=Frondihabitans australicus TaxID=386892 RepID=A0A495IFX7_9MICO|nr:acyl-CoA/acyl-ACP dehydrogenase [Frondihabitans australicus]RKR74844.1 hypothetical protein C8E83_1975 [Frondihabitans australicus]
MRVALAPGEPGPVTARALDALPETVDDALDLGKALGPLRPFVGLGGSLDVWEALATLGAHDLGVARAIEPHVDALTILDQADSSQIRGGTWGVFAAEGPGARLEAVEGPRGWELRGVKPWCSLASVLSDALVTAWVDESERRLFRVRLGQASVRVSSEPWHARGLQEIPSGSVEFSGARAFPVGETGWYLRRPGFTWGGISVAACWFGGAVGLGRALLDASRRPSRHDDAIVLMHLGIVDARLTEARSALAGAAAVVDSGHDAVLVGKRVRATVARCAEDVLLHVGHALGPEPLVRDREHAKRAADLEVYLRQHHGERDDVSLGRSVRDYGVEW